MVGQTIGKYHILDRIGRGSMGTVYRAEDKSLHREVAIKILNADLNDPAAGRRFRAEAIAVARLNHPGIAKVYDLFEHDGQWLMAMEFVSGETLEALVTRGGPVPAAQAADLTSQALRALAHAHGMGVVHRDLKPANLMVTGARLKIMDFGIARVAGTEHLTSVGLRMGTPAYMAPEQVLGQDVDARTDIFAMGCVMFFLTTGELPFRGDNPMEMVQARLHDDATPIRTLRHELPVWFGVVLARALARNPADRFQKAEEFQLAIERGLAGLPLETDAASNVMETMRPGAMPVAAAETPASSTPDVSAAPTVLTPSADASPRSTPAASSGRGRLALMAGGLVVLVGIVYFSLKSDVSPSATPAPPAETVPATSAAPALTSAPLPATPPAASGAAAPPPASSATPTATTPALTSTPTSPASTAAPTPSPAGVASDVPVSFDKVSLLKLTGKQGDDMAATLTIGNGQIVVSPRPSGTNLVMPYKSLMAATHVMAKDPQWAPKLPAPPADLEPPRNKLLRVPVRNWLVLQSRVAFLILILPDNGADQILKALTDRTHIRITNPK